MEITKLNTKGLFKSHLDFSGKISLYILARPSQKPFTAYQVAFYLGGHWALPEGGTNTWTCVFPIGPTVSTQTLKIYLLGNFIQDLLMEAYVFPLFTEECSMSIFFSSNFYLFFSLHISLGIENRSHHLMFHLPLAFWLTQYHFSQRRVEFPN